MMKKIPMILLLSAPYLILFAYYQTPMDVTIPLCIYGVFLIFNMVYAFLLPRLGFNGKQILFWNMLLKLCNIPLVMLIRVSTLVLLMIGGKNLPNGGWSMVGIALVIVFLVRLSSAMFGISGLRWFRRCGKLSRSGAVAWSAVQLIPCVDVIGAILCCIRLRRETLPAE